MESNFSSDNQNHQIQPGGFDFGRYSVYAGVAGLFLLSFSGVYITFFFGVVGLACALSRRGRRVLLIDGDAGLRSLDRMLGVESSLV